MSSMLSVRPPMLARTFGGTIMLKESIDSKSSWLGCFSKQLRRNWRVAAMLVARSSESICGCTLSPSPKKLGSDFVIAAT
jgi:hypothetical protein